jgi:SH3-like domain-containing protein
MTLPPSKRVCRTVGAGARGFTLAAAPTITQTLGYRFGCETGPRMGYGAAFRRMNVHPRRWILTALAAFATSSASIGGGPVWSQAWAQAAPAGAGSAPTSSTGLPVPRFVSLKSDRVHVRQGPGVDHKVLWVYRRAGLPLEILQEFEGWRQVRDSEGATGWVLQSLVSGRRTALILPWEAKTAPLPQIALLSDDRPGAKPVAIVEAGVIANVRSCNGRWCYVSVGSFLGYVEQKKLWGVYDGEPVK